jgi:hypothetical protein
MRDVLRRYFPPTPRRFRKGYGARGSAQLARSVGPVWWVGGGTQATCAKVGVAAKSGLAMGGGVI